MRIWIAGGMIGMLVALGACSQQDSKEVERKAGKAAYVAAQKTKQAAKKAAHELDQAARQAHQGWEEAERERQAQKRK